MRDKGKLFNFFIKEFKKKKQIKVMPYKYAIKKLAVNREEKKVLDLAKLFAYIKDLRDDFRRQGIYYIQNSLFQELSKRIGLNLHDMAYLREKEIIDCLQNNIKPDVNKINERKKGFIMMYNSNKELVCVSGKNINETLEERRGSKKNIDLTFLRDMAEGSEDFIKEMIEEFIKQTPAIIDDMNKYLMDKNWNSLNETAHKLKPGIDFMGIHSIKEVVINLEKNAAEQTNLQTLPLLMAKITDICAKAIEDLKNMTISKNDK